MERAEQLEQSKLKANIKRCELNLRIVLEFVSDFSRSNSLENGGDMNLTINKFQKRVDKKDTQLI